eukprot:Clim_evm193s157 gene=Clim_evmTU193s157
MGPDSELEFEEDYMEEFDDNEMEDGDEEMETGEADQGENGKTDTQVYLPGENLDDGEELKHDDSAYHMLHMVSTKWPCMSFDILKDGLGDKREDYPMEMFMYAGTTAERARDNELMLMRLSQMKKTHKEQNDGDDSDSDDDDDMDDNAPEMDLYSVSVDYGINRVRSCPQYRQFVSTWGDDGKVRIHDMSDAIKNVQGWGTEKETVKKAPVQTFTGHTTEGFSMAWSPVVPGRFASGDCDKYIYVWNVQEGGSGWIVDKAPYAAHSASVEDIQWSPNEANVFASCSVDKTVRIWDARKKAESAITVNEAHSSDVNVIDWNKTVKYLMVSGGDDGLFKVWDLRNIKAGKPIAQFKWHRAPITSVEWHPTDDSIIAVSGADDQVSLWDLSVEKDDDELASQPLHKDVPPQLLFIHQGQSEIKEIHWHPQIPGALVSTALSGFHVFKTISV